MAGVRSLPSSARISGMPCLNAATLLRIGKPYSRQKARICEINLVREDTIRSRARCKA